MLTKQIIFRFTGEVTRRMEYFNSGWPRQRRAAAAPPPRRHAGRDAATLLVFTWLQTVVRYLQTIETTHYVAWYGGETEMLKNWIIKRINVSDKCLTHAIIC